MGSERKAQSKCIPMDMGYHFGSQVVIDFGPWTAQPEKCFLAPLRRSGLAIA